MVKPKNAYRLPFGSLADGEHEFSYTLDEAFMETEGAEEAVEEGFTRPDVRVAVRLLKADRLLKLNFTFEGQAFTPCDRCLREIAFPVQHQEEIIVKVVDKPGAEPDTDDELWCVGEDDTELDLKPYFHEVLVLSRPLQYFCPEDENGEPTCDPAMLKIYEQGSAQPEEPEEDPRWAALKALRDKMDN